VRQGRKKGSIITREGERGVHGRRRKGVGSTLWILLRKERKKTDRGSTGRTSPSEQALYHLNYSQRRKERKEKIKKSEGKYTLHSKH